MELETVVDGLSGLDVQAVQRNFDQLSTAMPGFGGKSAEIRFWNNTVTWSGASATSNVLTVAHGLGRIPAVVVATLVSGGGAQFSTWAAFNYTATIFQLQLCTVDASIPPNTAQSVMAWVAIG